MDDVERERIGKMGTSDLLADTAKVDLNRRVHEKCKAMKVRDGERERRGGGGACVG